MQFCDEEEAPARSKWKGKYPRNENPLGSWPQTGCGHPARYGYHSVEPKGKLAFQTIHPDPGRVSPWCELLEREAAVRWRKLFTKKKIKNRG